jgi:hypothetical protein
LLVSADNELATNEHRTKTNKVHVHGLHEECPLPKNVNDIVACAIVFHPDVKKSKIGVKVSDGLYQKMAKIPNPTFSSRYIKNNGAGQDNSEIEANLSFTLEIGGKRDSRKGYAKAIKQKKLGTLEDIKALVKTATIYNLYRLRQIFEEKEILGSILLSYKNVIAKLRKRPRLTPEQDATLSLFEVALEEGKINQSELYDEEKEIEHFFHVATGHSIFEIRKLLPKESSSWPIISQNKTENTYSTNIQNLKANELIALSELKLENSDAWPDLKIGPSVSIEKNGINDNKSVGFNISFPLPIFNVNNGGKVYARQKLYRAKKTTEYTQSEENHERYEQLRVYQNAINILNKTDSKKSIERKYLKIKKLYLRGVISSSIYLESIKSKLNYIRSRNNRELTAISALWKIYQYDGKVFKENL